jgi:putative tryptophan/tyrosine transport system substrate-binding protein
MRRREFITLVGGAAAWPIAAFAQQRLPHVGVLLYGRAVPSGDLQIAVELARIGDVEGRNIAYEIRGAEDDITRLPPLARDLAAARPEVLVGSTAQIAVALSNATREIPIVITMVSDPIALGLSASISRPTGNVTGFTISSLSLAAKRLEILHEVVPAAGKIAYLWAPQNPSAAFYKARVQQAAEALGVKLVSLALTSEADIVGAFARADEEQVTAVLTEADTLTYRLSGSIVDRCLIRGLPAMHSWSIEVRNGALMSYGPAEPENNARAALYVDRILKGAKVAELPFEEPTEINLAINLRTARSIGLAFSPAFIMRADEVIE